MESHSIGALSLVLAHSIHGFTGYDWALLSGVIVSLIVAAGSAAAETALTSVNRIRIRNLAEEGDRKAQRIRRALERPEQFLSTILVVSNVSVIAASTLATIIAVDIAYSFAEIISTILLSLIVLIFCEITPKTWAVQAPERAARLLIGPLEVVSAGLRPVVAGLTTLTSGMLRLLGVETRRHGPFMTEDELRLLVEVGEEEGVLEEEERAMIHNVFDLADTSVREVMAPRIDMVTVEADDTIDRAVQLVTQGGFSRIPVFDDSINDIIGVLYAKDLLRVIATGQHPDSVRQAPLRSAYFVPESKRLDDLLHEMQKQRVHMAIVVDEYGAVAGLVTIEDVVEEIFGDIKDEYDKEEQIFERVSDTEFLVDAKISVDELNELIDAELPAEDYDTLGGFVYTELDKIPTVGDVVRYDDLTITVLASKGRRVTKVKIVRERPADDPAPTSQSTARERGRAARESREIRENRENKEAREAHEASDRAPHALLAGRWAH
ncbi:MAG TPA: hemolysin family protein [Ktedonobacterales bacterium]